MNPKDDSYIRFVNALKMISKLQALFLTLKRQPWINERDSQSTVLTHLKNPNYNVGQLASWASKFLNGLAEAKAHQRRELKGNLYNIEDLLLDWLGLGPGKIIPPKGKKGSLVEGNPLTNPRPPQIHLEYSIGKIRRVDSITWEGGELQKQEDAIYSQDFV